MTKPQQKSKKVNKLFSIALVVVLVGCSEEVTERRVLPIVGDRDVVYKTIDGEEVADTIYHHVPDFEYINQDSVLVKSTDIREKVWITDFFFTHCPSICPPMTSQMKRLSENTKDLSDHILFLSFSIDPDRDTPSRLREYIQSYAIEAENWQFFTGEEEATHLLAKEFFNGAERNDEIEGGFGHTSYFAIVDTEGLVRGIYDGTNVDQVDQLEADLRKLMEHEYGVKGNN